MPVLLPALSGPDDAADVVRVGTTALSRDRLLGAAAAVAGRITGARAFAVRAEPSMQTVVATLGGLLAGVPVVPVPADSGTAERAHILRDSAAEVAVGLDELPPVPVDLAAVADPPPEPPGDATALILYTSGTTGAPKGVLLSRRAIAADLDGLAQAWGWSPADTLVHGLPLFHVHGLVLGVLGPLRVGGRLIHTVRPRPDEYARAGGTLYFGVPTVWSRMVDDPESARALRTARLLVSGSAPLPVPVFHRLTELTGAAPVERYGMTETLITLSTRVDGPRTPGSVGRPLAGIQTRLSEDGELQLRGPTLFSGYLGRPTETADSYTSDGWFRTGDIASAADGEYRIVGRASVDLIKSGGFRIGAGEIEDALLTHPAVREAAVVGRPDSDLGQRVVAFVVASGCTETELIEFVADRLAVHKRPRQVHFLDALPRNAMGKLRKSELM